MSDATTWTGLLLQKQGMQARADQEAEALKLAQMRQLLGAASQFGGALTGAIQQQRTDDIANRLMNEEAAIPRATALDPAMQSQADAKAAKMPGFHTGGMAEMKLSMAMEDQKMQRIASDLAVAREARYSAAMQQQQTAVQQADAAAAFRNSSKDMQESFQDSMAYYKTLGVGLRQATEAQSQQEYDAAASGVMAMYQAAKKRGLEVDTPNLPAFVTPEQRAASAAQQAELAAARDELAKMQGDIFPNWLGGDEKQAAKVRKLEAQQPPATPAAAPAQFMPQQPAAGRSVQQLSQDADADLSIPVDEMIPTGAVELLRKDPSLAPQFDAKYGAGASRYYLE
jgi:hypothetical protein